MFSNHDMVKPDTIIEIWKKENWESVVDAVTKAGLRTIVSSPWYLNYISYGSDSMKIYLEDPQAFGGTEEQERLVVGGEVSGFYNKTFLPRRGSSVSRASFKGSKVPSHGATLLTRIRIPAAA